MEDEWYSMECCMKDTYKHTLTVAVMWIIFEQLEKDLKREIAGMSGMLEIRVIKKQEWCLEIL